VERHLSADYLETALRDDVTEGLTAHPKHLRPVWFYDERGSDLFEEITRLPEYYPTRVEREILVARAGQIAAATGARTLVELGSGSSEKTRLLLDALHEAGTLTTYVPVDVSESALVAAATALRADHPWLAVHGLVADFTAHLGLLPPGERRLVAFLGSTIGNLVPAERAAFLVELREALEPGDALLLGTDLVKDPQILVAAYDDRAGVTAEFNKNVLRVLNRQVGADFDPDNFAHVASWDADREWIEMRLRSRSPHTVKLTGLDLVVDFAEGEDLRTEISAKFRREGVTRELAVAGFELRHWWTDLADRFALSLSVLA
jgi:L-histidine N-alpha-methyltransferase